ncbi:asparagine synthase-related protein [Novispirillum itersonii]|uniref:asparagine synthase (glutamine-hydrolyzing) n=1 Tax=Novispirillum itersonii TaxID=189 RepID=A0A7W9ZF57_NOVIT|nr:asparagine synthase-related protein [Novispirillum itersonii]MBB6210351.1 asparagine synthase (glutamine-hydrolyzing) [Novispirillum itersonii]
MPVAGSAAVAGFDAAAFSHALAAAGYADTGLTAPSAAHRTTDLPDYPAHFAALSAGQMVSPPPAPWLVIALSGGLHNRESLQRSLPARRQPAPLPLTDASPDIDFAVHAVLAWGDDAPARLDGDFALMVWNRASRRLLLACDPSGSRSLFYSTPEATPGGGLLFASTLPVIRSLLMTARGGPSLPVDVPVVAEMLAFHWPTDGRTAFQGVRQVPPGGRLIWDGGTIRVDRPRAVDWDHRLDFRREEDCIGAGRALLDQAVENSLRNAGRNGHGIACHLTAGLDSAGVVATAARLRGASPLDVLTIVPAAAAVAAAPGIAATGDEWPGVQPVLHRYPSLRPHRIESSIPDGVQIRPLTESGGVPVRFWFGLHWHRSQADTLRRLGQPEVLTGNGGNMTLSWSPDFYPEECLRQGALGQLWRYASAEARRTPGSSLWKILRQQAVWPLLPPALQALWHRLTGSGRSAGPVSSGPAFSPAFPAPPVWRRNLFAALPPANRSRAQRRLIVEQALWRRCTAADFLPGTTLHDPLWSFPLLEFCMAVPDRFYGQDGKRSLARRVLADRLPAETLADAVSCTQGNDWHYHQTPRRDDIAALLERFSRSDTVSSLLDLPRLRAILDDWPATPDQRWRAKTLSALSVALGTGDFILWAENPNL